MKRFTGGLERAVQSLLFYGMVFILSIAIGSGLGVAWAAWGDSLLETRYDITATVAEINYSDGVTSNIQTQLDTISGGAATTLADTKIFVGQSTDLSAAKTFSLTGDVVVSGLANTGAGAAVLQPNTVESADIVNGTIIAEDMTRRYAEMYFHDHSSPLVTTLTGTALANVIGLTNGIVSSSGMTQNDTNGSVTVAAAGIFEFVGSMSLEDPDSGSEEYNGTVGIDGTKQEKCEWHTDITVQSSEEPASISCLLSLSGGEVVTFLVNSAGGDDAGWQALNWYLKEF